MADKNSKSAILRQKLHLYSNHINFRSFEKLGIRIWKLFRISNYRFDTSKLRGIADRTIYYLKIWLFMSRNSFMVMLMQKKLFVMFLTGKILRFVFFIAFLIFLVQGAESLAGYNTDQIILIFLAYNFVDIVAQFVFREVYRFRPLVVSGDFDLILTKPVNGLFRVLMGGADIIDFVTIPPLVIFMIHMLSKLNPTGVEVAFFGFLLLNALLIAAAFHIAVLAFGILTLEVDHVVWIYRDVTSLGRLPIDIYRQPLRVFLTYLLPVGVMMSFPAKALFGLLSPYAVFVSFVMGGLSILASLRLWNFALTKYSSASS